MPNWCSVTYKVTGKDIIKIYEIYNTLQHNKDLRLNVCDDIWWGDMIYQFGGNIGFKRNEDKFFSDTEKIMYDRIKAEHPETLDKKSIYCRGWIQSMTIDEDVLSIYYESAWQELSEVRNFLEENLDIDEIVFYAEEPGMEIYETNDTDETYFKFKFVVDYAHDGIIIVDYYDSEQKILKELNEYYDHNFESIDELKKFINDLNCDDSYLYVYKVKKING